MAVTMLDIAREAGVGEGTVGRALRGKGYVSPTTKERILKVAAKLNYQPNHIARSLVLGKSDFVGIVAGAGGVAMLDPYLETIEQAIRKAGYSMLFYMSNSARPDSEMDIFHEMIGKRVAAAVIMPGSLTSDPKPYKILLKNGIKVVIADKNIPEIETPQLVFDHYMAARMAAEHLICLGHRNITYLAIPETSYVGRERGRGFRDALTAAGIPIIKSSFRETDFTEEAGFKAAKILLKAENRPTAIVTRHDIVAVGVIQSALAAGLSVPKDLSVVGHGDIELAHALWPPLTTIHNPSKQMASLSVKMLLDMLSGKQMQPATKTLAVKLVIRSSTAPPRR